MARSPSYPQISLPKAVELVRQVYSGAHKSAVDSDTVIKLLGYSLGSGRGLAVVGALKQYGLLEGRDDKIRVTPLALSLLEPIDDQERFENLKVAAEKPELFAELRREFGNSIPAESVIRSIAIRKYNFTNSGADNVGKSYLETMRFLKDEGGSPAESIEKDDTDSDCLNDGLLQRSTPETSAEMEPLRRLLSPSASNVLQFPLSKGSSARVEFFGEMSADAVRRLIKHLELAIDIYE